MNYSVYDSLLWLYIIIIFVAMAIFFGFIVLLFYLLKWSKLAVNSRIIKKWIRIMGIFFLSIFFIMTLPAFIDICANSYCIKEGITDIKLASETASSRRIQINHTLICKTQNGDVYECYDYLYGVNLIEEQPENNCIVYGKHSKLLLDWTKV